MPTETRRTEAGGRGFAVGLAGEGDPLVLLHGFPLDRTMWGETAEFLSGRRLIVPDLRGFGGSDPLADGEAFSIDDLADDVVAIADAVGVTGPFDLAGLSMGGYVALSVATRHADRVGRVILTNTRADTDTPEVAANRRRIAETVLAKGTAPLAAAMTPNVLSEITIGKSPKVVGRVKDMIHACRPATVAAAQHAMAARPDRTGDLPGIDRPVLCVAGSEDTITPPAVLEAIAAAAPHGQAVTIAGAGHLTPLERPRQFADAVLAFLDRTDSAKAAS
ncbi:MAG: alpha/beta fold hydrolase [Planctomycetota bacterium]